MPIETRKPTFAGHKLNMMVYGPPGTGKTTLVATANDEPLMTPYLHCSIEGGELALIDMANPPDVYDVMGSIKRFEDLYHYLAEEEHPYKSVGFDSLSELHRLHRETLVASRANAGKRLDMFDTQQKDWGDNMSYILFWMRRFRDLPMHFLATCHSEVKAKPNGQERCTPLLNKALVEPMCGIFDVVGYYLAGSVDEDSDEDDADAKIVRKLLIEPRVIGGIEIYAKDRSPGGRIGRVVTNPTMPLIMRRLSKKKEEKPAQGADTQIKKTTKTTAKRPAQPAPQGAS